MSTPVFWLESTDRAHVYLRVYESTGCGAAEGVGYCEALVDIHAEAPEAEWAHTEVRDCGGGPRRVHITHEDRIARDDSRWPTACTRCGREFGSLATRQLWAETLYAGSPDGRLYTLRHAPVGACYNATWLAGIPHFTGPDGIALTVVTPGGVWQVDSEASNCTRKGDRSHKCWIRHGDPRDPQGTRTDQKLHVDKNGPTCNAGAGSIQAGSYHGFLHDGALT